MAELVVLALLAVAVLAYLVLAWRGSRAQVPAALAAIGLGVLWGSAADPHEWLVPRDEPPPFDAGGDLWRRTALKNQTPSDPYSGEEIEAWQERRRVRLREVFQTGPIPSEIPIELGQTEQVGSVQRQFLTMRSTDGTNIPAYLLRGSEEKGAILLIPGHGVGIRGTAGLIDDYQHAAALRLAEAGYLVLTPELRGFGLLSGGHGPIAHRAIAFNAWAEGSSYKAVVLRDLFVALRVLRSKSESDRTIVAGASLGGELATLVGALDPSIDEVCVHAYGGSVGPQGGATLGRNPQHHQLPHGCHTIPGVNRIMWHEDWFRLIAPRPLQIVRGDQESTDPGVLAVLLPRGGRLELRVAAGDHEFFVAEAIAFLDR
ncbi:MAG: dienelactone hydrolase family protein [Planctomycetota bacterium]